MAIGAIRRARPIERRQDRVLAGVLDWVALGAVVAAIFAISRIHGWAPWLLGPFTATILYLVIATLQLAAVTIDESRLSGGDALRHSVLGTRYTYGASASPSSTIAAKRLLAG
jgi:hypothetical protein